MGEDFQQGLQPEKWLDEHGNALYRYALSRTGRADAAQDLVQETLLAAWKGRDGFQGVSTERTWLLGICRHKTLDYLRQSMRIGATAVSADAEYATEHEFFTQRGAWRHPPGAWVNDPLGEAEAEGFWTVLQDCVSALPESQRESFVLRTLSEVDASDASTVLGVSPNHLYVLLHRARLRLRRCLQEHWFGDKDRP